MVDVLQKIPQVYLGVLLFLVLLATYVLNPDNALIEKMTEGLFYALLGGLVMGRSGSQTTATVQGDMTVTAPPEKEPRP